MASESVLNPNEIHLDGKLYRTVSLTEKLSSVYPEKQVFGDYTKISDPTKSQIVFSDWTRGIGQWYLDEPQPQKAWWSSCQLRHKGHLILPFGHVDTNDMDPDEPDVPIAFIIASDVMSGGTPSIFACQEAPAGGSNIYSYADGGNWTGRYLIAGGGTPSVTDAITLDLGGTVYLVVAHANGYCYTSNGTAWSNDTTNANIKYLAAWEEKLWMISNTGQLYYCTTLGTEEADAKLRLEQGSVTDLFVGPDAEGEPILYVATTTGLYAHDFANARLLPTGFQLPEHSRNGGGCCVWNENIYFPSNMGVWEYSPRTGTARRIGLDLDDGLPAAQQGYIKRLVPSLYEILALVDCSGPTNGETAIYGWNGQGWEMKWRQGSAKWNADYLYVSSTYSSYRIWFAAGISSDRKVRYIKIPPNRVNPEQLSTLYAFGTTAVLHTPWFTAGQDGVDKIALKVKADLNIPDINTGKFTLNYCRDWSETTTLIVSNHTTSTAVAERPTEWAFPVSGDAVGVAFRAIKFVVTLTGSASQASPDLRSLTLEYVQKLRVKREWVVTLDLNQAYDGQAPGEQRSSLNTALAAQTLVRFTFRDDADNSRRYNVLVFQESQPVLSGHDERGLMTLHLVEP